MVPQNRWRLAVLLASFLSLGLAGPIPAADEKTAPPDAATLNRYFYSSLRSVINYGADQYNKGNVDECYQHFRSSLKDLVPVLSYQPELQKFIEKALDQVENDTSWRIKMAGRATMPTPETAPEKRQKAFALRAVLNDVRTALDKGAIVPREPLFPPKVPDWPVLPKPPETKGPESIPVRPEEVPDLVEPPPLPRAVTPPEIKAETKKPETTEPTKTPPPILPPDTKEDQKPNAKEPSKTLPPVTLPETKAEAKKPADTKPVVLGTVSGRITFEGKPVMGGVVFFLHTEDEDKAYLGVIGLDGAFEVKDMVTGPYRLSLASARIAQPGGKPTALPAKYGDAKTSGLTLEVKGGKQVNDLNLQK
jgi:hypothetical protein